MKSRLLGAYLRVNTRIGWRSVADRSLCYHSFAHSLINSQFGTIENSQVGIKHKALIYTGQERIPIRGSLRGIIVEFPSVDSTSYLPLICSEVRRKHACERPAREKHERRMSKNYSAQSSVRADLCLKILYVKTIIRNFIQLCYL